MQPKDDYLKRTGDITNYRLAHMVLKLGFADQWGSLRGAPMQKEFIEKNKTT